MQIPLFDLGNVFLKVDYTKFWNWIMENSNTKDLDTAKKFHTSSLYYDFEFGNLSTKEFIARMEKLYNGTFHEDEFTSRFCDIFPNFIEGMPALIQELRSRGDVFCLTNTNELHYNYFTEKFKSELEGFTHIFSSHLLHKRKPYPGVYREVSSILEVHPREIFFFDDLESNVRGAHRAGLSAVVFQNAEQVRSLICKNEKNSEIEGNKVS